jgi:hypothetical protein
MSVPKCAAGGKVSENALFFGNLGEEGDFLIAAGA